MKVLIVSDSLVGFGGAQAVVWRTARALSQAGCPVLLATARREPQAELLATAKAAGWPLYQIPTIFHEPHLGRLRNWWRWRTHRWRVERGRPEVARWIGQVCRTEQPDVAHVFSVSFEFSVSIFEGLSEAGVPIVFHPCENWPFCARWYNYLNGQPCRACLGGNFEAGRAAGCYRVRMLPRVDVSLPIDRWRRRHWAEDGAWRRVGAFVAPAEVITEALRSLAVPAERIHPLPYPPPDDLPGTAAREGSPAQETGTHFVYYGSALELKGIDLLAQALSQTRGLDVRFYVNQDDAQLQRSLEAGRRQNRIEIDSQKRWATGVAEMVATARAVVVPSLWETVGEQTMYEAMALGRAVVASRRGAHLEWIEHGRTGLLFDPEQPADLAACLMQLHADAGLAQRLGAAGQEAFRQRLANWTERLLAIYDSAIGRAAVTASGRQRRQRRHSAHIVNAPGKPGG